MALWQWNPQKAEMKTSAEKEKISVRNVIDISDTTEKDTINHEPYVMPYINKHDDVVIPFEADPKYFYWAGGQALESTLNELKVSDALWRKYSSKDTRNK